MSVYRPLVGDEGPWNAANRRPARGRALPDARRTNQEQQRSAWRDGAGGRDSGAGVARTARGSPPPPPAPPPLPLPVAPPPSSSNPTNPSACTRPSTVQRLKFSTRTSSERSRRAGRASWPSSARSSPPWGTAGCASQKRSRSASATLTFTARSRGCSFRTQRVSLGCGKLTSRRSCATSFTRGVASAERRASTWARRVCVGADQQAGATHASGRASRSQRASKRARQDLNLRPLAPEASALSTELRARADAGYKAASAVLDVSWMHGRRRRHVKVVASNSRAWHCAATRPARCRTRSASP